MQCSQILKEIGESFVHVRFLLPFACVAVRVCVYERNRCDEQLRYDDYRKPRGRDELLDE